MAADPRIVQYIREQTDSGKGKEEIYKALLSAGWSSKQINEAIYEIIGKNPPEEERPEKPYSAQESPASTASTPLGRYIREQMDAGFRRQQIYDALIEAGWYKEEVDKAFYELASQTYGKGAEPAASQETLELHPKKPLPEKPGFFWKLKNALFHPGRLFEAVKNEKGVTKALSFFGILYFINFVITLAFLLFAPYLIQSFVQNPLLQQVFQYFVLVSLIGLLEPLNLLINYAVVFAFTLLGAAIIQFFVYVLRGNKGFYQTYKALMYATAPIILLSLVLPLYLFSVDYPFMVFPAMGLAIIAVAWSVYIAIRGLSKLHEISLLKAAIALIIIPLAVLIAVFFVVFSFFLGMFNPAVYTSHMATGFGELGKPSDWQYSYGGTFSVVLKNNLDVPVTINSVTANCGSGGSNIVMETLEPMHLEAGGGITYSTGDEKCALKNPGEAYSVSVTVRYLQESTILRIVSGTVTGNVS